MSSSAAHCGFSAMVRTQISLTEEQLNRLRAEAVGRFDSGSGDVSATHDEIAGDARWQGRSSSTPAP